MIYMKEEYIYTCTERSKNPIWTSHLDTPPARLQRP